MPKVAAAGGLRRRRVDPFIRPDKEVTWSRATLYALLLRQQGYATAEAAALVIARYPETRPIAERLTRPVASDPFARLREDEAQRSEQS